MNVRPCGLLMRGGAFLTLRYRYGARDRFNLPGGGGEAGESLHQTLIREFSEELQLPIQPGELLLAGETLVGGRETLHLLFRVSASPSLEPRLDPAHTSALELAWLLPEDPRLAELYPALGAPLGALLRGEGGTVPIYHPLLPQSWFAPA
ncbi:MAG: NUDIX hydrolase [Magnetococcales bacterium]|nr:NUDIX hydrolase [Magnetococcales bacterium]